MHSLQASHGNQSLIYDHLIYCSCRLIGTDQFKSVMRGIKEYQQKDTDRPICGLLEADPEYKLIVESNNLTMEIDNEINIIHKFCR